jgi:hypothetical protein
LLKADRHQPEGSWRDNDIKDALDLSLKTLSGIETYFLGDDHHSVGEAAMVEQRAR